MRRDIAARACLPLREGLSRSTRQALAMRARSVRTAVPTHQLLGARVSETCLAAVKVKAFRTAAPESIRHIVRMLSARPDQPSRRQLSKLKP